jgi:hypothetical protein
MLELRRVPWVWEQKCGQIVLVPHAIVFDLWQLLRGNNECQTIILLHSSIPWLLRFFFSQSRTEARLRSRLYPSASSSPCYVSVVTWQTCPSSVHTRLPFPENHLGELQLQPYVHNCAVFFKRHCHLQPNWCLTTMVQCNTTTIQGNVIIVCLGSKALYVNMHSGDAKRTDWLMRRWVPFLFVDLNDLFFSRISISHSNLACGTSHLMHPWMNLLPYSCLLSPSSYGYTFD